MNGNLTQPSLRRVPPSRYLLFLAIAAIGCYGDLLTKRLIFEWRGLPGEKPVWWIWNGFVGIETALNTGALFGSMSNHVNLLAILSAVALVGVVGWFVVGGLGRSLSLTIVLGCITAGILGNMYDRFGLWSVSVDNGVRIRAVRDWIRLSWGDWVWPNFNVADSLLVCSAAWLVWYSFREPIPEEKLSSRTEGVKQN